MTRCLILISSCACVALGVAAGCGGGDERTAPPKTGEPTPVDGANEKPSRPLSRAAFTRGAERTCERLGTNLAALERRHLAPGPISLTEIAAYAKGAAASVRQALAHLRTLVPPRRLQARVTSLIEAAELEARGLEQVSTSENRARELLRGRRYFGDVRSQARRLRLVSCAEVS